MGWVWVLRLPNCETILSEALVVTLGKTRSM